jgi:CheY-like chemotaxis protein
VVQRRWHRITGAAAIVLLDIMPSDMDGWMYAAQSRPPQFERKVYR